MFNETQYKRQWDKQNCIRMGLYFTNSSGIPDALRKMSETTGETPLQYIRRIVTESLIFDGFLKTEPKHPAD